MARLYLNAKSKKKIGYTPDWIKLSLPNNEEITFDIRGDIDYDKNTLSCRVKGYLDPWVLNDVDGEEHDLSELSETEIAEQYPDKKICEMFKNAKEITVGIYPVDDSSNNFKLAKEDVLSSCSGKVEIWLVDKTNNNNGSLFEYQFAFNVELND